MALDPRIVIEIEQAREQLRAEGHLRPESELRRYYATFADRFGPQVLRRLDGPELLTKLHDHGDRESLVYWLEFKNDEEMPAIFGSIAGGSALKFGIYRRKETGMWMTGSPKAQEELSLADAIAIAQRNRSQLVAAADILERFRARGSEDYEVLEQEIMGAAPEVGDTAWGHKYLSLLFPDVLDDYHVASYQHFHLIKLLIMPPEGHGRYASAGELVTAARQLDLIPQHLTAILNKLHGEPYRYFRLGTGTEQSPRSQWAGMRDGGYAAIGWPKLDNLSNIEFNQQGKEALRERMGRHYASTHANVGKNTAQVFRFVASLRMGDLVLAADGARILGIGRVTGDYIYEARAAFPHRRPVEWFSLREWTLPVHEALRSTLRELRKYPNQVKAESVLLESPEPSPPSSRGGGLRPDSSKPPPLERLEGIPARIQALLERKGQVILFGPPGTGKTYWAERTARELAARSWFGKTVKSLSAEESEKLDRAVTFCSFHAGFGYEDFLEGFRPTERGGFERRDGVFKRLCDEASRAPERGYYLIIDEINRGDVTRIFGELLTVLEKSRRKTPVTLALSGATLRVPDNVFLLGTMNTADRSIALLDAALRRRFGFIELMPEPALLRDAAPGGVPLYPWLQALNARIREHLKRDARSLQIGHSYLLHEESPISDFHKFVDVVRHELIPLVEEYCYEDPEALERILGSGLVRKDPSRIDESLFEPSRHADLVQALLQPSPEITTTVQATASDAASHAAKDEADEDEQDEGSAP